MILVSKDILSDKKKCFPFILIEFCQPIRIHSSLQLIKDVHNLILIFIMTHQHLQNAHKDVRQIIRILQKLLNGKTHSNVVSVTAQMVLVIVIVLSTHILEIIFTKLVCFEHLEILSL